jgi:hypothetical protein
MADLQLRSLQQIIGSMASRLVAETDVNDLNPGSVLLTILEAAASSDFQLEAKLIQLMNLRNIDKATGADLENLATEMGVVPSRIGASASQAMLTIGESAFSKVYSTIYAGSSAPVAGDSVINIVSGAGFKASGSIYIGRNTQAFEQANYVSIAQNGSYYTIALAAPLGKNHLVGEEVVMAQGGDRAIGSGTVAFAAGVGLAPSVQFVTAADYTLLDGEDTIVNVPARCSAPGTSGNVGIGQISSFVGLPWSTATVTNPATATGGQDPETDFALRERVKSHTDSLSGATANAIISTVIGTTDDVENKTVVTAYLREPTTVGGQGILFIDDGTGFEPIFSGVGEEIVVSSANGGETLFQLQQWPLVKAQAASVATEPFALYGGEQLYVEVDGVSEQLPLSSAGYTTAGVVTAQEVAEAINNTFLSIEARAKSGQLFITPTADDPTYVRVGTATTGKDANSALAFPTTKAYTITLYKNDELLEKDGAEASVQTIPRGNWTGINSPAASAPTDTRETLQLTIDGILSPVIYFSDIDFDTYTSSATASSASVADWVTMINRTFIGVTATAQDDGTFLITSNRGFSSRASVAVSGGSLALKLFAAGAAATGSNSQFTLNRLAGTVQLATALASGDTLTAGTTNTAGFVETGTASTYNLGTTLAAQIVFLCNGKYTAVPVAQAGSIAFTVPSSGMMRVAGVAGQFSHVEVNDWCHFWGCPETGVLKVYQVASDGSHVDFFDPSPKTGTIALDGVNANINFFRTASLPELATLPLGAAVTASAIVTALNSQLLDAYAQVTDTGAINIQTTRLSGSGALAIPSITGGAITMGLAAGNYASNDPHIAAVESADLSGTPSGRITVSTVDSTAPYTDLQAAGTPFAAASAANRPIVGYLGSASQIIRQPADKVSSSELTLRQTLPAPTVGFGPDYRGTTLSGLELGAGDNVVFLLDNSPSTKTFDIPMYVEATVAGPSVPSTSQFDATDSTGALLGSSSRWAGFAFEDYRAWFQAYANMPFLAANSQLKMIAQEFGPNGQNIQVGYAYPALPSQAPQAGFTVDPINDVITVTATLGSGAERTLLLQPNMPIAVTNSSNTQKIQFLPPVDLSSVLVGDIAVISDSNSVNNGPLKVQAITSLVNNGNAFQFLQEAVTVDVVASTTINLDTTPSQAPQVGDTLTIGSSTLAITALISSSSFTVAGAGFTSGSGQSATLNHQTITTSNTPSFTVAAGDNIVCGSYVLTVTSVLSSTNFAVNTPFAFTGLQTGSVSRITLEGARYNLAASETFLSSSVHAVRVYDPATSSNAATTIAAVINNTAGVKDLVFAENSVNNTGAGSISLSTQDALGTGTAYVSLLNGEQFVYSTAETSPALQLKAALPQAPQIGDKVRFIPMTAQNVADHFNKKQISGLSVAANIELVDAGRRIQVSTLVAGGLGQVYAVGGRASGQNILAIRQNAQQLSSSRAQIELDRSSIDLLAPGQAVRISQAASAKKAYPGSAPVATDTIEIQVPATGEGKAITSFSLVNIYSYSQTGAVTWAVRKIGRNRTRFEVLSGAASVPSGVTPDDWVLVGNGSSYAGLTTDTAFAPGNQGWFQVRETDNSTYFDVDGQGVDEFVSTTGSSLVFCSYASARPGDQLVIGFTAPVATANKGTFTITSVPSTTSVLYQNATVAIQAPTVLSGGGTTSISVLDQGYSTYRTVMLVAPKPTDPTNRSLLVVSPGYNLSAVSESQGAVITLPNRLGYGTEPVPGMDGYGYWAGLKQRVQRVVDGYAPDATSFPGIAAAGVTIEVREPKILNVAISLTIKPSQGVSLQSLSDTIQSSVEGYVNSLGLGQDVILSEVVSLVQSVPGVDACVLTKPLPSTERISVGDSSIARVTTSDILLS